MQYIKGGFSFRLKSKLDVWERSFAEHRIKDKRDYSAHVAYIEQNPVVARLCLNATDYPYSSAARRNAVDAAPAHLA